MDSSFYTRVGEGKYEVHFETGEKWKYVLVEAACREAIGHGKAFMVTENIVRCVECRWYEPDLYANPWGVCFHEDWVANNIGHTVDEDGFCYRGEREVQE